ncbi:hypothetical protein [Kitasatospora viridis]|uniref:Lipoprotein n=1 Tax=Kitasatospora viridis TaxID=281105 RepID=A0A561UBY4_9ACTN|nr:hypothetical protein [Kitasatospora viridis]TWF96873.1 hypothetical protein FHX73_11647 [Kitasatospora viridis]
MVTRRWGTTPLALGLAALAAAGCSAAAVSPGPPGSPAPPPQPQIFQAESVARQEFGLLAGGGWAQAWALWDDSGQQAISQADFVKLNTECRPALGVPYVIGKSTELGRGTVRVDWQHGAENGSNTLEFTRGSWHFAPDAASLADYRKGVDQVVAQRRAAAACH